MCLTSTEVQHWVRWSEGQDPPQSQVNLPTLRGPAPAQEAQCAFVDPSFLPAVGCKNAVNSSLTRTDAGVRATSCDMSLFFKDVARAIDARVQLYLAAPDRAL